MRSPFLTGTAQVEAALDLPSFNPSTALGRPLVLDAKTLAPVLGDGVEVADFASRAGLADQSFSVYATKDDAFAVKLDIVQIADRQKMRDQLAGSFRLISAPLDELARVEVAGTDIAARRTEGDNLAVASRGDVMVMVSTPIGTAASVIAGDVLALIWGQ